MKTKFLSFAVVLLAMACIAPPFAPAQPPGDRRPGSSLSRGVERKEPLLLRNLFGKRKAGAEAPADVPAEVPAVVAGAPAPAPGASSEPVKPESMPGEPARQGMPQQSASEAAPAGARTSALAPATAGVSATDSVAAAINRLAAQSGGKGGDEVISSASKVLEGNREELKTLASSLTGDPAKLLTEGKNLLRNPEVSASAHQALQAVAKPGGPGGQATVSSLEEVKKLAEKAATDPGLVAEGKQLLSKNQELVAEGKEFLKENEELLESGAVKDLKRKLPGIRDQLAQGKAPAMIPPTVALPPGPLPPWVAPGVPAPRDPVVAPIPRPEVPPEQMTRITAEFARFDANTNVVTFEENVELHHHEFDLQCQVLIAELKPGKDGNQPDPRLAKAQAAAGGIRRATAKGFVVIQKISAEGKIQVAKSREAVYDAESGDVVLSDFPQLQDGNNLISGAAQTTKIYLRKNGKYEVKGLAEYELVPEGDALKILKR